MIRAARNSAEIVALVESPGGRRTPATPPRALQEVGTRRAQAEADLVWLSLSEITQADSLSADRSKTPTHDDLEWLSLLPASAQQSSERRFPRWM
jgi:hypothetical protein